MQRRTPTPDEETRRGPNPGWTIAEARRLIDRGWTHQEVADEFHIRRDTLRRRLHRDNARRRARSAA